MLEALAIFASHGLADTGTTILAYLLVGASAEANPLVASLLTIHPGVAAAFMLGMAGLAAAGYAVVANLLELSGWYALAMSFVGVLVATGNLLVAALALAA